MPLPPNLDDRRGGVLLHLTSLPGPHGCGDLGPEALGFAEFLSQAGQTWWQMLPVGPPGYGNCPYMASSAFALGTHLLSLETLSREGRLAPSDLRADLHCRPGHVAYEAALRFREPRLRKASAEFFRQAGPEELRSFETFCAAESAWLDDHALYCACKDATGGLPWTEWEPVLRRRDPTALARARTKLAAEIRHQCYLQYELSRQWTRLRGICRERGIGLIGDVPIFVAHESADVWAHPEIFHLDDLGNPTVVAGVPPDYFSPTGQRWGHPLYRWDVLRDQGYAWWIARLRRVLTLFDAIRLDHFIGFQRYWEIPVSCPTAVEGRWMAGPGEDLFRAFVARAGRAPIIAEDLGLVTEEVTALRERLGLPGMRVLQFAFGGDPRTNDHLPHRYTRRSVVYPGTHDNDTTVGWFRDLTARTSRPGATEARHEREFLLRYLNSEGREIHWDMIRLAHSSVANLAMIPAQDLLGLGSDARMNRPSEAEGNWEWRLEEGRLTPQIASRIRLLTETYGRLPSEPGKAGEGS